MANQEKRLVVVLGATGSQGAPVVEYLLKNSSIFNVRAVTRDPASGKAQALVDLGAEVVKANFDDEAAMRAALKGANAIFCITDFFDNNSIDSELFRGLLIARLATELPDLDHFILSALPDGRILFGGKYQFVLPYNAKTYIQEGIKKGYPSLWKKTTALYISYYYQNWVKYPAIFAPTKRPDGTFVLSMPHAANDSVSSTSSRDTGAVVDAILRGGSKYFERTVALVTERLSEEQKLKIWAKELGVQAVFQQISAQTYRQKLESFGIPQVVAHGLTELAEVFAGQEDYVEAEGVIKGREILGHDYQLKNWAQYVKEEDWSSLL